MLKKIALAIGCVLALCDGVVAASAECKDCNANASLTIREQIKADRARDVERVAKESNDPRPWDIKNSGQTKPVPDAPTVR
jgi:hypothetical protein